MSPPVWWLVSPRGRRTATWCTSRCASGKQPEVAYALPLSVDGMLVVASIAMVDDRSRGRRVRPSARTAFAIGVVASIAANITAAGPSWGARTVAAWPALALLLVVEMLSHSSRTKGTAAEATEAARAPAPNTDELSHVVAAPMPKPAQAPNRVAGALGATRSRRPTAVTRRLAAEILHTEPNITRTELANRLGVSTRRLRDVLASEL
jgi:hypothetical protein